MPARVLMVTPRFAPYIGGVETHVHEVARRLSIQIDLTLLTTDPSGKLPTEACIGGVHVIRVPAWPAQSDLYVAPAIYRYITAQRWDMIHVQSYHTFVAPLALLAAQRATTPYLVTFHSGGHSSRLRTRLRGLQVKVLSPLLQRARKLVCVSDFEVRLFARYLGLPSHCFTIIPNGVDPVPEVASLSPQSGTLILSVGRLERYKGHQRMIAALPALLQQQPDIRLCIVGSGPYETNLRKLVAQLGVSDRVEIRTIADRTALTALYGQAAAVVLLSEYEAHPIAVLEALSAHRPVLVADTSGLRDLADRGLVSTVPLNSTPEQISSALLDLLRNPSPLVPVNLPTWDDCAHRLFALYTRVIEGEPLCVS